MARRSDYNPGVNTMTFCDIRFNQEKDVTINYSSGLTCYTESLSNSRWVGREWSISGFIEKDSTSVTTLEKKTAANMPIEAFDLEIDGHRLNHGWKFISFEKPSKNHAVHIENPIRLFFDSEKVDLSDS